MNDQGIGWMIAGGGRNQLLEDQRMRPHRHATTEVAPSRTDTWQGMRERIAAAVGGHTLDRREASTLDPDCCPA